MLLLTVENLKVWIYGTSNGETLLPNLVKIGQLIQSEGGHTDKQNSTQPDDFICLHIALRKEENH
jgi:hypothetical protein